MRETNVYVFDAEDLDSDELASVITEIHNAWQKTPSLKLSHVDDSDVCEWPVFILAPARFPKKQRKNAVDMTHSDDYQMNMKEDEFCLHWNGSELQLPDQF